MAGGMTDVEFRAAMRPLTSALASYAKAAAELGEVNGLLPAADSPAMAEIASQSRWSQPDWKEPAYNAHVYGSVIVHLIAEHIASYAAIINDAAVGPTFAHLAHLRAVMDSSTVAHWLTDPTIGVEARIQRSLVYRLNSANQLNGIKDQIPSAGTESTRIKQACIDFVTANGWAFEGNSLEGETLPRDGIGFCGLALGAPETDLERVLWTYASSTQHAKWFALGQIVHQKRDEVRVDPLDPSLMTLPIIVEGETLRLVGCLMWRAAKAVVDERCVLMGWQKSQTLLDAEAAIDEAW
jgi:hypothetical protein